MIVAGGLQVPNLDHEESNTLDMLVNQWRLKLFRNELRTVYYDTKNTLNDLRISLPPQLARAESMLGWPAKAVHALGSRCSFDGFVLPGQEQDPFGLAAVFADNNMDIELPQAIVSGLTHSVAFLTTTKGDVASGEPDVQVLARSAKYGTALWDRRRRRLSAALAIADTDEQGEPVEVVLYMPSKVVFCSRQGNQWKVERRPNPTGRVLVTPLVFRPELDRPFGHSRISRSVMALTDAAVRTFVRSEVGAEFYASPQRYLLGADEDAFGGGDEVRWRAVMSRMLAIGKDEDGDIPTLGQFPQMTMQPHNDQLRMIAGLFAGETGLSLGSLGIVHDNPASAEAIFAEKEDLIIEASAANRVWGSALRNVALLSVMVRDNLRDVPEEMKLLQAKWRSPATPSVVSASDAMVKQIAAIPWLAESDVALESLGYDQATITRLKSDKRRFEARQVSQGLGLAASRLAAQRGTQPAESTVVGDVVGDQSAG